MTKKKSKVFGTPPAASQLVQVKVGELSLENRATYVKGTVQNYRVWGVTPEQVQEVVEACLDNYFGRKRPITVDRRKE